jgi:hypothetical protein
MPTYTFVAYDPSVITESGGTLTLDSGFDPGSDTVSIEIEDDDDTFDGDTEANDIGNDPNQVDPETGLTIYAEERYVLDNGTEITRVEIEGDLVGYILNGPPLDPGTTYTISEIRNPAGATGDTEGFDSPDTYSELDDVPCFIAGTRIATPEGPRPVERIRTGDLVLTLDNGPQRVRWTGLRTVVGRGELAPVIVGPGVLGNSAELLVSAQHRLLLQGAALEIHFGHAQVFAHAKHLVDGNRIRRTASRPLVSYCHLGLDRHEVIFANEVPTESLFAGDVALRVISRHGMSPAVPSVPDGPYGPDLVHPSTARTTLKRPEARLARHLMFSGASPSGLPVPSRAKVR